MAKPSELSGRIINCILPKGTSSKVMADLFEKGFTRVNFAFARGFDIHDEPNPKTGIPKYEEKEMLTFIAKDEAEGEELFNTIYNLADINRLGGGIMYMSRLSGAVPYMLPQIDSSATESAPSGSSSTPSNPPSMVAKPRQ